MGRGGEAGSPAPEHLLLGILEKASRFAVPLWASLGHPEQARARGTGGSWAWG